MLCDRMGISPKWPSYKVVKERINALDEAFLKVGEARFAFDLTSILKYINREDEAPTEQTSNKHNVTDYTSESLGRDKVRETLALASENWQWLVETAHWMRYYEIGVKQDYFWHHQFRIIFPDHPNGKFAFSMQLASEMMATMAVLGWKEQVIYQGYLTHAALHRNYQLILQYQEENYRAQAFMLRLFANWVGDVSHTWPAYAYDEPIYEALLMHWRRPNPDELVPCLLAACDRHTHQAGKETLKKFFDFNSNTHLARVPIEILFLLRLRQWEGLVNPVLEHPLMAPPFHQLPPEQPVPDLDELMQGVLKRAREDWPQYDEVLSLKSLKLA